MIGVLLFMYFRLLKNIRIRNVSRKSLQNLNDGSNFFNFDLPNQIIHRTPMQILYFHRRVMLFAGSALFN